MSGYPNYNSPQGWKPPVYTPPALGPQFTPQGSIGPDGGRPKKSGGNGCVLAAFLVLLFVGTPLLVACAGIVYLFVSVSKNVEEARAKFEADHARRINEAAKAFPNNAPNNFPNDLPSVHPGFPQDRGVTNVQEAIDSLNSNDWQRQGKGAEWLAKSPVEEDKRAAAAAALEGQLSNIHRNIAENSLKALAVWGSKENSPRLIAAMKEYRIDRMQAIEQLGKWQDPASAIVLAEFLDDRGADGKAAETALAQIGPSAKAAVAAYLDPHKPLANERAEKLLVGYGVDLADAKITARLATLKNRGFQRGEAIKSLAAMPLQPERQPDVARALEAIVGGADRQDREEAMLALLVWGDKESVPAVIRYLKGDPFPNKSAVVFLGKMKDPQALEPLASFLDNFSADDTDLVKALAGYGADGEKVVLKSLHDPRNKARERARAILTSLNASSDALLTQTLADLSSPEDRRARNALEWLALATVDDARKKEVTGKLVEASRHPSLFIQIAAVEALIKLNDPAILPDLASLAANSNTRIRLHSAFNKTGAAGEDLLIGLLAQEDLKVVGFACQVLIQVGTEKARGLCKTPSPGLRGPKISFWRARREAR